MSGLFRGPAWVQRAAVVAFLAALGVVGVLLLLPGTALPQANLWDKLQHAAAFALLAVLGGIAFPQPRHRLPVAVALILFGVVCELLQLLVPGRSASVLDAVADAVGVLGVVGLWVLVERLSGRLPGRRAGV